MKYLNTALMVVVLAILIHQRRPKPRKAAAIPYNDVVAAMKRANQESFNY
jgi:hypothetical protein